MMDSLNIGKAIYTILQTSIDIDKKIYPLIADEGTTFPFIIYKRTGLTPESTKDNTNENVSVEINIASSNYSESIDLAIKVRKALEHKRVLIQIQLQRILLQMMQQKIIQKIRLYRH